MLYAGAVRARERSFRCLRDRSAPSLLAARCRQCTKRKLGRCEKILADARSYAVPRARYASHMCTEGEWRETSTPGSKNRPASAQVQCRNQRQFGRNVFMHAHVCHVHAPATPVNSSEKSNPRTTTPAAGLGDVLVRVEREHLGGALRVVEEHVHFHDLRLADGLLTRGLGEDVGRVSSCAT